MLTLTQTGILSALCLSQIRWYNKRKHWSAPPGWGWRVRGTTTAIWRDFGDGEREKRHQLWSKSGQTVAVERTWMEMHQHRLYKEEYIHADQ